MSRAHVVEDGDLLALHFESEKVQTRVLRSDPDRLVLAYTRTMMGFLLVAHAPRCITMIGLGGGSLVRACRRALPEADFTAVEVSADVVALREVFGVPPDGPRFRVRLGDGAAYLDDTSLVPVDVLLVDGFDPAGQPPALCSPAFYAACAARLAPGGVLVVNLNADATGYGDYVRRVRDAFPDGLVVVETDDRENKIVFALRGAALPPVETLHARAATHDPDGALGLAETAAAIAWRARKRG